MNMRVTGMREGADAHRGVCNLCLSFFQDSMLHVIVRAPTTDPRRPLLPSPSAMPVTPPTPSSPYGFPSSWLSTDNPLDANSADSPSDANIAPFQFLACRRQPAPHATESEIELITHFTNTVTHFCWTTMIV